jgi:hypothetical protein
LNVKGFAEGSLAAITMRPPSSNSKGASEEATIAKARLSATVTTGGVGTAMAGLSGIIRDLRGESHTGRIDGAETSPELNPRR